MSLFEAALAFVLKAEGGDTNDPHDQGGLTRFGIAQASHPEVDVLTLTLEGAKTIYKRDYWGRIQADQLPPALAMVVFDSAVNLGVTKATGLLQQVLGVEMDGRIGLRTLDAAENASEDVLERFLAARITYYATRPGAVRYLSGWAKRCFAVHRAALEITVAR